MPAMWLRAAVLAVSATVLHSVLHTHALPRLCLLTRSVSKALQAVHHHGLMGTSMWRMVGMPTPYANMLRRDAFPECMIRNSDGFQAEGHVTGHDDPRVG